MIDLPGLDSLLRASWQGAVAAAAVWLLCRFVRLRPAVRCALWWGVSLKLLVGLAGLPVLGLPVLPPATSAVPPAAALPRRAALAAAAADPAVPRAAVPAGPAAAPQGSRFPVSWPELALAVWIAGLAVAAGLAARELRRHRGVRARALPVADPALRARLAELSALLGLRRPPALLASAEIAGPQAVGLLAPAVLLPAGGPALAEGDLEMALCHELVHLRRRDLWLGWVPALAERIFFFHPLAALAAREYALAREAACDAQVLRVLGAAPQAYGRLILKLGVGPRASGWAAAGASPSFTTLKRRLEMLQQQTSDRPRRSRAWLWLAAPAALLALAPLQIVRADDPEGFCPECVRGFRDGLSDLTGYDEAKPMIPPAGKALGSPYAAATAADPASKAMPASRRAASERRGASGFEKWASSVCPECVKGYRDALDPAGPNPMVPPTGKALGSPYAAAHAVGAPVRLAGNGGNRGFSGWIAGYGEGWEGGKDGQSFVLTRGEGSTTMNGTTRDLAAARRLKQEWGTDVLVFRRGGKTWAIRDSATLGQANALFAPQQKLGDEQGALGDRQAALGEKQAALGERQAELGQKMAALSSHLDEAERGGKGRRDAGEKIEELGRQQEELGRQQAALGERQAELGDQQAKLGERQGKLAAEAEKKLQALIDRAVASGLAQEVKP